MATYTDPTTIVTKGKPDAVQTSAVIILLAGLALMLIAGFFGFEGILKKRQADDLKNQAVTKQQEYDKLASTATELDRLSKEAKGLHTMLDTQKHWNAVFDKLSERLLKSMAVTTIQATDNGTMTMSGIVPDYESYAKAFRALTDDDGKTYVTNVKPTSVSKISTKSGSYVSFTLTFALQPTVLNAHQ